MTAEWWTRPTHILILNTWPQFPGSRRWDNSLANYPALFDHRRHEVAYVCTASGLSGLDTSDAVAVKRVADFDDRDKLEETVAQLIADLGLFDRVIAFSELLLDAAAFLRERFDILGPRPSETTRFRDKAEMKERLSAAGVRVPRWWTFENRESFL